MKSLNTDVLQDVAPGRPGIPGMPPVAGMPHGHIPACIAAAAADGSATIGISIGCAPGVPIPGLTSSGDAGVCGDSPGGAARLGVAWYCPRWQELPGLAPCAMPTRPPPALLRCVLPVVRRDTLGVDGELRPFAMDAPPADGCVGDGSIV